MDILENINDLGNKLNNEIGFIKKQDEFLKSNLGQIVNSALDMGLRAILPDFFENEVIDVKNSLINGGINEGINSAIENTINLGKKVLGIDNKTYKSIEQAENVIKNGGLIKGISNGIDNVLSILSNKNIISEDIINIIKNGKNLILNNVETNVENDFNIQIKAVEKIEKYIENWEKYYKNKDVEGLTKEYNKMEKQMKKIMPLENLINNVNKIRDLNNMIKNNDNFEFNTVYLDLAKKI